LINVLKANFDLDCSIFTYKSKTTNQYRIYIKANSVEQIRSSTPFWGGAPPPLGGALVKPHMHSHIMYKLTLRGSHRDSAA
jgi:hypothetical protein